MINRRLKRLEDTTNRLIKAKNPMDILTDDELDLLIDYFINEIKGKPQQELSQDLQEKLESINNHPSIQNKNQAIKQLSEEEEIKETEKLLKCLEWVKCL